MVRRTVRSQDGFSLFESLVTASMLGVLATVAVPSLGRSMEAHRVMAGLRTSVNQVRVARSTAIVRGVDARVALSNGGHTVGLEISSDGGSTWTAAGSPLWIDGAAISAVSPSSGLRFSSRGLAPAATTVTVATNGGASRQFTVSILGAVEVQ